jgi:hypothetical protein
VKPIIEVTSTALRQEEMVVCLWGSNVVYRPVARQQLLLCNGAVNTPLQQ